MNVFLSASIPSLERSPKYYGTMDVLLIKEAIKGLILVLIERDANLIFGGHPAITPLVRLLFCEAGRSPRNCVTLYQSAFFKRDFPKDNEAFERVVVTEDVGGDKPQSLSHMRRRMLTDLKIDLGIFIGGMEGVEDEFNLFKKFCSAPAFPIGSTGAAAKIIYNRHKGYPPELVNELTYPTLFRKLFRISTV